MNKLKLGHIVDDKPVKLTIELPAKLHQHLIEYAALLASESSGGATIEPAKLIVPMLHRFIAGDREFARRRRASARAQS